MELPKCDILISLDQYQSLACSTAIYPPKFGLAYTVTGLAAEAGELVGKYAKALRDDAGIIAPARRAAMISELGDVLWFAAMVAQELGTSLTNVAKLNIQKLQDRQNRNVLGGSGDYR